MKIGIITIHNSPNYGACLQSYALYKYINMNGGDVEVIDLHRPIEFDDYIPSAKYVRCRKPIMTWKMRIKRMLGLYKVNVDANKYSPFALKKFENFNSEISLSKPYRSIDELYANPPKYDLYITGSDQVWNPTQNYCLEPYFLTFVAEGQGKKISYASSIGINDLTIKEKSLFKKWLSSYDAISIREKQGKVLLQSFINRDIKQVPDPTFLLSMDFWREMAIRPQFNEKYILLFTLRFSPILLKYCLELSKESNLKLIVLSQIQPDVEDDSYIAIKDAGPKEFIGYIKYAEMVITDSFHCTVFSIILGTSNFYTYISPYNKRGSRIIDLLESFSLLDHLLPVSLDETYAKLMQKEIKHDDVNRIIINNNIAARKYLDPYIKE